ncbi:TRAP transporter large permease [Oceanithermus desulfurans]|uniref:C4-dicarboxylate ABC transporter permease n=2 Tax=Oceanithermus desulfurans TaxID=227924 RepID=A0A511RHR1_9DEIN|nr:TRAP transporter large permease [Oceanithermus desulfurans]MBB6029168.1 C4-dicarboxylate transporter DctM subunit [Oceanithermus desulfurans]GEM89194.1 C4-dicarboxylate ABC transporter permease [Oceanithermus desulfurans NBRC 100063]
MSVGLAMTILFGTFVVLLLVRVPIGVSLAVASLITFWVQGDFNILQAASRMFEGINSFALLAIPGFVFTGVVMARGGIAKYLVEAVRAWVGHLPGGLSVVVVVSSMIFAAISGSSPATAAAIGSVTIPAMIQNGYSKRYAMGLVATSGTLGILIPPSITMIIYGITTDQSIGKLFIAGIIPGILLGGSLIVFAIWYAIRNNYGRLPRAGWPERWRALFVALPGAFLPFLIMGTIYSGIATPTESSVIALFYAVLVSLFIYRETTWRDWIEIVRESVSITSMIYLIVAAAMLFSLYMTQKQVPQLAAEWIAATGMGRYAVFAVTSGMFIVLGMFLEAVSIILITLPVLQPILETVGIDLIHFAVVMTISMELAMITPPVGLNLFVISGITRAPLGEVVRGVIPFYSVLLFVLVLLIFFPELSLWLPGLMK